MKIQINDCTIRDGGYLLNKNSSADFVNGIVEGLIDSNIDIIEAGFLQNFSNGETIVYNNSVDARRFMPQCLKNSSFTGFCDNSRYSIDKLDEYDGKSFEYLRISFAKYEKKESLEFISSAKNKGYKVFANPMDAPSYSENERAEMIKEINEIEPYCFSIVDTFGTMYLDDLEKVFTQVDSLLKESIRIGLHSHNNLQLSNALAETFIDMGIKTNRDIVVDASLYGMGRGAGNASTEVIANFLNTKYKAEYNIGRILETIENYILPLISEVRWGYDLPMFICGMEKSHVDNIEHLKRKTGISINTIYSVIKRLSEDKKKRYGIGYVKNDFSVLDKEYLLYLEEQKMK